MTEEQAIELYEHLTVSLFIHGFGNVLNKVNNRFEESIIENNELQLPKYKLRFFLQESINILENLSSHNIDKIIHRLNQSMESSQNTIESIHAELVIDGKPELYNLRELPSYREIINVFEMTIEEIQIEN